MCPDPQLLSIYLDGELPSPWKEKMQEHFTQCSECKAKHDNYMRLRELFKKDLSVRRTYVERIVDKNPACAVSSERTYTEAEMQELAKERVWQKIKSKHLFRRRFGLTRRRLSVPLPVAAAAAVILLLATAVWFRIANSPGQQTESSNFILAAEERIEGIPGFVPAADMNGVLQYLTPDSTNIIILQLPESTNFFRSGEPAIIRAADFSRNQSDTRRRP